MRYTLSFISIGLILFFVSCKKAPADDVNPNSLTQAEKGLVASAGFNSNWAERTADGNYLIEGDVILTKAQLTEMAGATPSNFLIVGNEEHYRTFNVVNTGGRTRTITISLGSGFHSFYSKALDNVITRYNSH